MSSTTKQTVRFADDNDERNSVKIFEPLATDVSLWLTAEECANSKKAQREGILKLRQKGADRLVENSFANPASDVQKSLNEFTRHTEGRGLERYACQKHYEERTHHRSMAIKAIILGQQQAHLQGLKLEDVSEQLRELYLQYACAGKIFARRMGKADEYACYKKSKSSNKSISSTDAAGTSGSSKKSKRSSLKKKCASSKKPAPVTAPLLSSSNHCRAA